MKTVTLLLFVLPVIACAACMLALSPANRFFSVPAATIIYVHSAAVVKKVNNISLRNTAAAGTAGNSYCCRKAYEVNYYNGAGIYRYPVMKTRGRKNFLPGSPVIQL